MKNLDAWKALSKEEIDIIIENYQNGASLKDAGKSYSLNGSQVRNLLSSKGIKQRKNCKDNRKYKVKDDYFKTQSSNMAYILGFWAADGNVSSTENRLDLELAAVDYEILEKINTELQNERPIKVYQCANGYIKNKVLFWSKEIKADFEKYGIVPNKTYSKDFHAPFLLKDQYWIDFIRGFFDGDGCVKKENSLTFELNSLNKQFLIDIQSFLLRYYQIETKISTTGLKENTLYRLYCYGEKAKDIFNVLYTPNSLYLQRKYNKFLSLL